MHRSHARRWDKQLAAKAIGAKDADVLCNAEMWRWPGMDLGRVGARVALGRAQRLSRHAGDYTLARNQTVPHLSLSLLGPTFPPNL